MLKKFLIAVVVIVVLCAALLWGAWLLLLPAKEIATRIELAAAQNPPLSLRIIELRKHPLFWLSAEGASLYRGEELIVSAQEIVVRPDFASLLSRTPAALFKATVGGGTLNGTVTLKQKIPLLHADLRGASLERLGIFPLTGYRAEGVLSASADMTPLGGSLTFDIAEIKLADIKIMDFPLPVESLKKAQGKLVFAQDTVTLESVSLEGLGFYARAKGEIRGGQPDINVELMPDEAYFPDLLLSSVIGQYRVSKGYYVIPVKGPLGHR